MVTNIIKYYNIFDSPCVLQAVTMVTYHGNALYLLKGLCHAKDVIFRPINMMPKK